MRSQTLLIACIVAFSLLLLAGCVETSDTDDSVVTVNLYSLTDTIRCTLWDEMPHTPNRVPMIAEVLRDGQPAIGVPISIDLHAAQGWCVYNDSLQQCTTYVNGRVEFTYVTISCHGGCDTIIVSALGKSASAFVYFDMDTMYTLDLHVSRDTLYVPVGSEDSTVISVWLKTGMGVGLADSTITLMASGGRFDYLPPTDSMGRASTWWHTNHEYGLFTLLASFSHATDTARIVVDSLLR